ncbi:MULTISPECIES: CPBP family intramembrane glutamic endopeptidase [Cyanophyceae]|uniref:CPBP family intramembrane glutamic endopeptidase n=1 Tax=Cyanophyceae TaxID=3028117 RepID=UPI0002A66E1D|nr:MULTISPECIES: type II CAAX endopeptidase family protein [Cyanophyceae]AFZ33462.1 Abortive infection protein [Gloeocapsa sp. PCC 7428]PPS41973.1 CPBP family intramembrane metalloprotease [Chroococcidiopsis sp. TS-821]
MAKLYQTFSTLARYPAGVRLGVFVVILLLLWLPIAVPIYWVWGTSNLTSIVTMLALYGEFIFLLQLWGQKVHRQVHPLASHGVSGTRRNALELLKGVGIGVTSLLCLFILEGLLSWLTWQSSTQFLPKIILEGLGVALGVGFAEELLFRGWLVDELQWDYGFKVALWISSSIYATLHFIKPWGEVLRTLPSFPGLLLLGLTLGWARQVSQGHLGSAIGLHAGLVWGYYIINVAELVRYSQQVPPWVTGIDRNPLAGAMGLLFLSVIALSLRITSSN